MANSGYIKADDIQIKSNQIFSPVRGKWLPLTPEERVRQEYLLVLTREYGYSIDQIAEEESVTGRGSAQARADFLIWRTVQDRIDNRPAMIVVECKSDNVTISAKDYFQGDNYARREGARFFVTHNNRETRYWRVRTDRRPGYLEEIENIPHANATNDEINKLISRLKVFKENEFADLLHQCHNVIRNREHLDPAAAFDEIAKVLFVKTHVERDMKEKRLQQNRFTVDYLRTLPGSNALNLLFDSTKDAYQADAIFTKRETAIAEVEARYQSEIEAETARIQECIDAAAENIKRAKPPTKAMRKEMSEEEIKAAIKAAERAAEQVPEWKRQMAEARQELRAYEKQMAGIKTREARQLLKKRFDYPVFLYDAQHVGLTATGEQDVCELYPSEMLGLPEDFKIEDTALMQYRGFLNNPELFILNLSNKSAGMGE